MLPANKANPTNNPAIEEFLKRCVRRRYSSKSTLICAGDKPETLYYLIKGSVAVFIEDENGKEIVLDYLNEGDFFGEMGLFDDTEVRSAWVRTRTPCEVAEISYARFHSLANENPMILFHLSTQMASRLRHTSRKVSDLAFLDVTGRIAGTLLELAKGPEAITHPDGMQIRSTRLELGRIAGCSREMAGRVLKDLEERNLISAKGKTIVVFGTR